MEERYSSPDHVRLSLAAAMTLDLASGLFYRNARLRCINLLLTYPEGCQANCAYCGLSKGREGEYEEKSFIRVAWEIYSLDDVVDRMAERRNRFGRACVSMVTHPKAPADMVEVIERIREGCDVPISVLITPTLLSRGDLIAFRDAGVDRVGIAIDAAREDLFDSMRGSGVRGPHKWERYWGFFEDALEVFGEWMVGSHFMVGLGETEREMVNAMQRIRDMGGCTHLFSFFAEPETGLSNRPQPPMGQYRRMQLARYLIDEDISRRVRFEFDEHGILTSFGVPDAELDRVIASGEPFMTAGCQGADGAVACNRPYANSLPGPDIRNFPFQPTAEDIAKIRSELWQRESEGVAARTDGAPDGRRAGGAERDREPLEKPE
jgi:biotin synthase-related radical SAM superfamily protein